MAPPLQSSPRAQRGFGLIEVLVALTILSIGMLGLAAMQLTSLQFARESLNTTIATIMVRDMNERAWAQQGEVCTDLKSQWKDYVANFEGLPSAHGEWGKIANGLYDLKITWQGIEDSDGEEDPPPPVKLVAFLPCKEPADD
ncbi:type IV pilus assembly protein PilV [Chromohalobacter marismortui]|uniref:Type IV pilus assembly protein PilV n=1 Tax=Chromohalobacter marismortui TaxID=42055 RepID=A0A4R7NG47_9GAMM|nr:MULTISPECIES: type IV pilus modification protein PilV [Chromohalobacter]MCI0511114.1 type IV pilus modification protein PilV [Chromohalobacter sp.]MCI0593218.1 type IV pilus modification protein PilV [Chromohalobacter sp.]TDU19141.1 type IV pilus assembly protein PilV [Chromohalobacter marismortui]